MRIQRVRNSRLLLRVFRGHFAAGVGVWGEALSQKKGRVGTRPKVWEETSKKCNEHAAKNQPRAALHTENIVILPCECKLKNQAAIGSRRKDVIC
jgi:hypothetical protein